MTMTKLEVWPLEIDGFAIVSALHAEQLRDQFEPHQDIETTVVEAANGLDDSAMSAKDRWGRVCALANGPSPDSDSNSNDQRDV
ncbi:MAG: hypothetical protein ACSLFI_04935 [Solirubrobacterales bacterium]